MRLVPDSPPPGPFRPGFWKSPLRGPWLTALLGSILLVLVTIVSVTGFLSHIAYNPDLGHNAIVPVDKDFPLGFDWPTSPAWLYALNQGLHVTVGIVAVPLLLAKLWSVIPRLFVWPPATTPAQAIERISLALLVSSAIFLFATGILNAQVFYPFKFSFVVAHYYAAWIFVGALVLHVLLKLPIIRRAYAENGVLKPLKVSLAETRPEAGDPHGGLVAAAPAAPTLSRRGLFALVGAGSLGLLVVTAGQSIGGPFRKLALLAPRGGDLADGPNAFTVNKTASAVGINEQMTGDAWRLELTAGGRKRRLSRPQLLGLELHTETLPIACVEGWSTTQDWTGVRLRDLARMAGAPAGAELLVESLQRSGAFRSATLSVDQVDDPRSLLALRVNGAELSLDHGFPARVIVPALPGVHNTKWVGKLTWT